MFTFVEDRAAALAFLDKPPEEHATSTVANGPAEGPSKPQSANPAPSVPRPNGPLRRPRRSDA
jgi:hypothetical protein